MRKRIKDTALVLVLAAAATVANAGRNQADPTPPSRYVNKPVREGATVWYCWYNGTTDVHCRLGEDGGPRAVRTAHRVDPRLPRVVHDILNVPTRLSGQLVVIPMHGLPFEHEMVGGLAHAVMCGTKGEDDCAILYGEDEQSLALLVEQRQSAIADSRRAVPPLASTR